MNEQEPSPAPPRIAEDLRSEAESAGVLLHEMANWLTVLVGRLELLSVRTDVTPPVKEGVEAALRVSQQVSGRMREVQESVRRLRGLT
jgi:hypothetical protein